MKVNEIIQRIQSAYSKGVQSDDSRLRPRHIWNKFETTRSKYLSQKAEKKQKVSQWNFQVLPCVELIKAPVHECPCVVTGCTVWRTKYELPSPITGFSNHIIQSVTSMTGDIIFDYITWKGKKRKHASRFTSTKPDYFIRNNYLYVTHKNKVEVLAIEGLWDDALKAQDFPSYCDERPDECDTPPTVTEPCVPYPDRDFPIDNKSLDAIIEMCVPELLQLFIQGKEDNYNNSRDNNPLDKDGLHEK